jgi:hypothetical protein
MHSSALLVVLAMGGAWISKFGGTSRTETAISREILDAQQAMERERLANEQRMQREKLATVQRLQTERIEAQRKRDQERRYHCWQEGWRYCN